MADKMALDVASTIRYQCDCGTMAQEHCQWAGPLSEMVVVEYMPMQYRASHIAARNSGIHPYNGSIRIACCQECADLAVEADPEWTSIVESEPGQYAECQSEEC